MKRIEQLAPSHDRGAFDCSNDALNQFFRQTARQHIQKGISRTFVLTDSEQPETILGFFTLSLCQVRAERLPSKLVKKYPSTVPGVKLARLASLKRGNGRGLGRF